MDFRICILAVTLVLSYSEQCTMQFDGTQCRYNMVCLNTIDINQGWERFIRGNRQSYMNMNYKDNEDGEGSECSQDITYGGRILDPVYLVFKHPAADIDTTQTIPISNNWEGQGFFNVIIALDLRANNYENIPVLKSMKNLAILDISRNHLTTAVLSNKYDLNKLNEINLSYNTISDINVNSYEHPYSSLTKINMSHNYLVKIPDAVFDKIDDVQTLDISYNYIEGLSAFTFEGTKNLLHLNLSNNRLTEINSSLFRFSELKFLSISGNKIRELKVSDFEKLNKLEVLDLSSNYIKAIAFNVFQNMVMLHSLDLSNNVLDNASKDMFTNLQSLSSIDLSRNKFKSLPKGLFKNKTIYTFSVTDNLLKGSLTKGMFEGVNVTQLNLSNQLLNAIEDYAFNDLIRLDTLLLSDNEIESLSNMCFKTLINLQRLDLDNNQIVSIDFNKADLTNLKVLLLKNNRLVQIKHEHFHHLNSLEYLDLSENAISRLEPSSFKTLSNLINLRISDNPLSGTLETGTFDGLVSLPSLDISRSLLTTVQNASFNEMNELKELNMSFSKIIELQYNVFAHTGYIETLDLSYNKLENFFINMTELVGLSTLLLNNNLIKTISSTSLQGLSRLGKISLAYNALENIHNESFTSLIDLRFLDLSYNEKFEFTVNLLEKTKHLETLNLSGIKTDVHLAHFEDTTISEVVISDAGIHNISALNLNSLTNLGTIVLSNNSVSKVEIGAFSGISSLMYLDLSFNKIYFIQPGSFKDNELLRSLNISHNSLSMIGYGIFRGLIYLETLDMSYNNIKDMQSERFYELNSLSTLIVDHNKIESITARDFVGTSLSKLSIGDNPLPCDILVNLKKDDVRFEITAIKMDEHGGENLYGVTCNKEQDRISEPTVTIINKDSDKNDILVDIRNILYNSSNKNTVLQDTNDAKYLENMSNVIEKSNTINKENLSNLANLTSTVIELNNNTNMLLRRILKSLQENSIATTTSVTLISHNKTVDVIPYINKIKKELENTIAEEKQNVINELEKKFSLIHHQTESLATSPSNEKLVSNNDRTKSLFTETCVALILLILVGLVLYKFSKSRMFIRNRFSFSTRELPGAMENSTL